MPQLVPRDHKYWCPGPWPWEWADTCTRHGHAWQYDFDWVHSTGFLFFSDHQGCEAGVLYSWRGAGGGLGSKTAFHVTDFFDDRLSSEGECAMTGAGGYPLTSSAGRLGRPPGLAVFKDRLYAAWKGMLGDQNLWWSSFGKTWFGRGWAPQQRIEGVGSSIGPALAALEERLYAVWKGVTGDENIWWSVFDGQGWAPQQRIGDGVGTSVGPSTAIFDGRLYAAWKGIEGDEQIWWSSFNGQGWARQQHLVDSAGTSVGTSVGPSIAAFNGRLYGAWKGVEGDQRLWWSSFDGKSWARQQHIVDGAGTSVGSSIGPSIAAFNGRLYAAWKGVEGDERLWWSSFDGQSWAPQRHIVDGVGTSVGSSIGPSLAVFDGRLYAAWKGIFGDQHIWWFSFEGQGWTPQLQIAGVGTSPEPA